MQCDGPIIKIFKIYLFKIRYLYTQTKLLGQGETPMNAVK